MAGDTEELGQHHADGVDLLWHLDAGQLLDREHVRQVVHYPAEVVDAVGVGDEAVPGLALGHFLGATVVVADVRYAVDDLFTVQLQDDTERTVRGRVVGAEVEEHVVLVGALALHAPGFRVEACRFLFKLLLGQGQAVGIELGGAGRVVLAQRVAFPGGRHHDAAEVRVAGKVDAEHVPDFALVPVGVRPDTGHGRQVQVAFAERHLDHHIAVTLDRQQVVEHAEVGSWQAAALGAQALVDAVQVVQHAVRFGHAAQEAEHFLELLALDPQHGHAGAGFLGDECFGAKTVVQFDDHILVVSLVGRNENSVVRCHGLGRFGSTLRMKPGRRLQGSGRQVAGSDFVGAAQVGYCNALLTTQVFLGWHLGTVNTLITNNPGKRASFLADRLLQQHQALQESLRAWRAARHIDVHGEELVDP